jgi:flagellin-like hook-associated protein FlgL
VPMTLAISSANYLTSKLALAVQPSQGGVTPTQLSTSLATPTDDTLELTDQAHAYLLLRDTVTEQANMVSLVQLTQTDLDNLASYLTDIQTRLLSMADLAEGAPERGALQAEIDQLERDMSDYIGSRVSMTPEVIGNVSLEGSIQQRYYDTLNLGTTLPDLDTSEIAVLEVDIGRVLMAAHPGDGCPLCQMNAGISDVGLVPLESTSNSGSNTGAIATTLSTEAYIEALRMSYQWDLSPNETLSYSYYDGSVPYVGYPAGGVDPASAAYSIAAFSSYLDAAFTDWDEASELNFDKVTESGTTVGELRNAYTDNTQTPVGSAAYAFGPGGSSVNGDIWFDQTQTSNQSFTVGSYGYMTALHEIGHAIGLSHPFDGSSSTGATLASAMDYMRNTIMSYTSTDRNYQLYVTSGGSGISFGLNNPVYASTPMIYDVAAVEYMYGVSTTTNTGDTTYTWSDAPVVIETLVDSGGNDTIDASNQTRSNIIDLTPGSFSSIGYWNRTDRLAYYQTLYGATAATAIANFLAANDTGPFNDILYTGEDNVGIAFSATIENAVGGQANDTLTGNTADNRLKGNAGDDNINGGGTNTAVFNGNYADYTIATVGGTTTVQAMTGTDGTDTLTNIRYLEFADLTWDLTAGAVAQSGGGASGGNASSAGSSGNATYVGRRSQQATGKPTTGDTALVATPSDGVNILNLSPANRIMGSTSNDQLNGSAGDDFLEAGAGDDVVMAGAGNDFIVGGNGEGDDLYVGGEGSDTIRYSSAKAGITVNLQLGSARATSGGDTAGIGVDTLREIENVIGGHFDDLLIGDAADNRIAGNGGNDVIDGGAGNDTAVFQGARNSYTVKASDGGYVVTAANGETVRLANIEFLQFSDGVYRISAGSSNAVAAGQPHIGGISLRTREDASAAINTIDTALSYVNQQRSALGAIVNVLDARVRVLGAEKTNTYAARSRILDTDYALETAMMARQMIIAEAGRAMLAMANQSGSEVMSLLR